jgi:hypothetical protein
MARRALGLSLVVVAAGAVRLAAARGDLWLDEIWSLRLATGIARASDVFTSIHLDNNHYLMSLWMFALGPDAAGLWYRLPCLLAGTASVALAAAAGGRFGRTAGVFAAAGMAACLPLVVYSSEARGYGLAVCFALVAVLLLWRLLDGERLRDALLFGAAGVLGLLAHLTFASVLLACFLASGWTLLRRGGPARGRLALLAAALAPPAVTLATLWAVDLRFLEIGGGNPASSLETVEELGSVLLGGPEKAAAGAFLLPVVGAAVAAGCFRLRRSDPGAAILVLAGVLVPVVALALPHSEFVHYRYVLVAVPFVFLALGSLLDGLWSRGAAARVLAAACVAAILWGDARLLAGFLRDGRGHYADAVRWMATRSSGSTTTVSSDHDFRNGMLVEYYARRLSLPRSVTYVRADALPPGGTDWRLTHSDEPDPPHGASLTDAQGRRYEFEREFPFSGVSGFWWTLYRKSGEEGSN